jgi:hypothetical protein
MYVLVCDVMSYFCVEAQKDKDAAHEDTKSHVVPTRGDVKKRATVSAANALRKMELEVRNKAYVLVYCIV